MVATVDLGNARSDCPAGKQSLIRLLSGLQCIDTEEPHSHKEYESL